MIEYLLRFFIGGLAVSAFAVLGDLLRPKRFAGLFGAAPSIALSTLAMAMVSQGPSYAATEGRSMVIGSAALCLYSITACQVMHRWQWRAAAATALALIVWFSVALMAKRILLG
jgi:hypothetical protein